MYQLCVHLALLPFDLQQTIFNIWFNKYSFIAIFLLSINIILRSANSFRATQCPLHYLNLFVVIYLFIIHKFKYYLGRCVFATYILPLIFPKLFLRVFRKKHEASVHNQKHASTITEMNICGV